MTSGGQRGGEPEGRTAVASDARLESGAVVTRAQRGLLRRGQLLLGAIGVLAVLAIVAGRVVHGWLAGPCDDHVGVCDGPDRALVCVDGKGVPMRCRTPCHEGTYPLCAGADRPAAGEGCMSGAPPLVAAVPDLRCSEDGRQVLACSGRTGVWTVASKCAAGQVCDPLGVGMTGACRATP